jgi:hypothetical protein
MFGRKPHGPAGNETVTRREFFTATAKLLGALPILGFLGGPLFQLRLNFYQKAWLRRNLTGEPISVYKMVALPGRRYAKADPKHMANKIYPSIEAARARRQHQAFFYGLKRIDLPRTLVNGMDSYTLFCGRKDFDCRVATDRRHWQRLGVNVDAVFTVVRNA